LVKAVIRELHPQDSLTSQVQSETGVMYLKYTVPKTVVVAQLAHFPVWLKKW